MWFFYFTGLPLCEDTEDITVPPVVTDVPYSIVPTDAKSVRVKSRNVMSVAEIHSSIPVLTVISLTLQLWDLFIKMDVMLAIIITLLQKSPPYKLLGVCFFLKRLIFLFFLNIVIAQRKYEICIMMDALNINFFSSYILCYFVKYHLYWSNACISK